MSKRSTFVFALLAVATFTFGLTQWAIQCNIKQRQEAAIVEYVKANKISNKNDGSYSFADLEKRIMLAGSDDRGVTVLIITAAVGMQFFLANLYLQKREAK
jgi:hypothetical protein